MKIMMTPIVTLLTAVTLFAAVPGADEKVKRDARLKELAKTVSENSVGFGSANRYYIDYYVEQCSEEMRAKILETGLAALKERVALAPDNAAFRLALGEVLLFLGQYKEALSEYDAVLANEKQLGGNDRGKARYERAECLYALGDTAGCRAALDGLIALKLVTWNQRQNGNLAWTEAAQFATRFLGGMNYDELRLPRDTGAKPYPMPKSAEYEDKFAPIGTVTLKLSGMSEEDVRVKLLKTKLVRFGVKVDVAGAFGFFSPPGFSLRIALDDDAPVVEKEGYLLEIGEKGAKIIARDNQGVLWGIVSFIQCIDQGKCAVRCGKIRDWPDAKKRGYLCRPSEFHLEFAIFNKINSVDFQDDAWCGWNRASPLEIMKAKAQAKQFADFGLDFYYGIAGATMYPHLPLSSERTFRRHLDICRFYAACGAGVYFPFDDCRYNGAITRKSPKGTKSGLHPLDDAAYGCAAKVDAEYLTRLYRAVKAEYPGFKMIFCPPFYWGPDSPASYPEDRETYLRSLGEGLDKEIDVYWTGPMVKGYDKSRKQMTWFADLIGRKPAIFQNGSGAHNLINYGVDPTPWKDWHYKGFVRDIGPFHENANRMSECGQIATLADYLWNEEGYDAVGSIRRATGQLVGKGVYEVLAAALPSLTYFDKYKYGELNIEVVNERIDDLEAKLASATNAWNKACAMSDAASFFLGGFGLGCGWAEKATRSAHKPPDFLAKYKADIAAIESIAVGEVGYDKAKGDILLTPVALSGGDLFKHTDSALLEAKRGRLVKCLRGAQTSKCALTGRFECDPFPPSGPYEMILVASEDERPVESEIEVSLNGTVVFSGRSEVPHTDYGVRRIEVPFKTLARYNEFRVRNLTSGTNPNGTPWLVVSYIVLKKPK